MKKERAVVLLSGGMDSCVTAAIAVAESECWFLHVSYGQRTEERERKAFFDIGERLGIAGERMYHVRLEHLRLFGGSSLTDRSLEIRKSGVEKDIPLTYVPFRNGNFLSVAVSLAEVIGASRIYIGAVEEDSSGYPDCRREFFKNFETAVDWGTRPETSIKIFTPLIGLKKSDIVKKGMELGAPFELTWSCYERDDVACGVCDSCRLRLKAFREAGFDDPIVYLNR